MTSTLRTILSAALLLSSAGLAIGAAIMPVDTSASVRNEPAGGTRNASLSSPATLRFRLDGISPGSFTETIERPLFWASRRPPPRSATQPTATSAPTEIGTGDLRLAGVMSGANGRKRALIVTPQHPAGRWLEVDGEIDGWRLTRIDKAVVSLEAGGRKQELRIE